MDQPSSKKIVLLNQTTLDSMMAKDSMTIIKNFTEVGITILEADFGFAWWKFRENEKYTLAYKSPTTPYEPTVPRENAGNYVARTTKRPFFDSQVKKENYLSNIGKYLRSYIIIPIYYNEVVYGSLVLCYKNKHVFTNDEVDLATVLGTSTAQAITIRRLMASEQAARLASEKQEAHFRALIENSYEIIAHVTETGDILYISPSIKKILGVEVKDVIGKNIAQFVVGADDRAGLARIQDILQDSQVSHIVEFSYKKKDGPVVFLEAIAANVSGKGGGGGIVINIRDITERKKLAQIKETQRFLEEERLRVESISDAAHELRTPIAIIKGNVDLALQSKKKKLKSPVRALRAIDYEIGHLSKILSDLNLITSKEGTLKDRIINKKVNLSELITTVVSRCKALASHKDISITKGKVVDVSLFGDRVYLEKMLMNVVKNSIIYGKKNGHTKIAAQKSGGNIVIQVIDDGIGIATEDVSRVFDRFYKVDKSRSAERKSTGLGLAIVKWIAEAHGGEVSVTSVKGKGSIFRISLPIKRTINA